MVVHLIALPLAQSDQHGTLDGRVCHVLDLDPIPAAPRPVAAVAPLGDDALQPHFAVGAEDDRAIRVLEREPLLGPHPALLAFKIYPDFERAARADPDHL